MVMAVIFEHIDALLDPHVDPLALFILRLLVYLDDSLSLPRRDG